MLYCNIVRALDETAFTKRNKRWIKGPPHTSMEVKPILQPCKFRRLVKALFGGVVRDLTMNYGNKVGIKCETH